MLVPVKWDCTILLDFILPSFPTWPSASILLGAGDAAAKWKKRMRAAWTSITVLSWVCVSWLHMITGSFHYLRIIGTKLLSSSKAKAGQISNSKRQWQTKVFSAYSVYQLYEKVNMYIIINWDMSTLESKCSA
jgi:hypothetical protein